MPGGNPPAAAEVAQSVRFEGQTDFTHYPHQVDIVEEGTYDNVFTLDPIAVPVNEWFNYRMVLPAVSRIANTNTALITESEADFASTLNVVGISITDQAGNPVDFTILADSGARYTSSGIVAPVPEPSTVAFLSAGLAVLGLRRYIRRSMR